MPVRTKVKPRPREREQEPIEDVEVEEAEDLTPIDDLLDEIDTVLEENMWVERYIQKGGQ